MKFLIIFLFSTTFIYAKENVIYIQTGWEHSWVENNTITQKEISIWFPISKRNQSFKNPKTKVLWLKTKIPDHSYTDPVLYIRVILQNFETYLDDTLIYHFGDVAGNCQILNKGLQKKN